jgi:uncharacterized protein YciI
MPTVVHCLDSSKARSERERSYDAHIEYLRGLKNRIRFAGPLATADDARGRGDDRLVGSLFVIDEPPSVTFELMQGDPYVASGVWSRVSVFQWVKAYGSWLSMVLPKPARRLYAALAPTPEPPIVAAQTVLFGAELQPRPMPGDGGPAIWRAVAIFSANSLTEARSLLAREAADRAPLIDTWSIPITVGTWVAPVQSSS